MSTAPAFVTLDAPAPWRTVDFISDLHLKPDEPGTVNAWADYLARTAADALFILGDLFEVWIGDDSATPGSFEAHCADLLHAASARMAVYLMVGNRDFLMGNDLLARCGAQALADPTVLQFAGQRWLLTHGDQLCISDVAYQQFRQQVRTPQWRQAILSKTLPERQAIGQQMRQQSEAQQAGGNFYADADTDLARQWLLHAQSTTLIHGHTHRPGNHALGADDQARPLTQVVLSDWHVAGTTCRAEVLRLAAAGGLQRLPPTQA
ncbi:UDP-2,3-diacylglucosamine diphosphatase [Ottowia sp.]|uniref:UDP-2,3-diacylglucosamine diphosphatase n=1 Tax=Ottowia sp. TaxID=1898956 RepID=UPI003A842473